MYVCVYVYQGNLLATALEKKNGNTLYHVNPRKDNGRKLELLCRRQHGGVCDDTYMKKIHMCICRYLFIPVHSDDVDAYKSIY